MAITVVNKSGSPIVVTGTTNTNDEIYASSGGVGIFIKWVYWYNPTAVGHLCSLKTRDGKTIIPLKAEAIGESQMWPVWGTFDNIYCDDMDSGTLYIYIK